MSANDVLARAIADGRLLVVRLSMLAPFSVPSAWRVEPPVQQLLGRLARLMPIAVTTSRPVAEARDVVGLSGVHLVGLSGGEVWPTGAMLPEIDTTLARYGSAIRRLMAHHRHDLQDAGATVEPHGTIHFADASGREDARAREAAERVCDEAERERMVVTRDLLAFKIRPAETGLAVRRLLEVARPDRVTYLGYDESDVVGAFDVLSEELQSGRLSAVCKVGALYDGHARPVDGHADVYVAEFEGVVAFLGQLATALTPSQAH